MLGRWTFLRRFRPLQRLYHRIDRRKGTVYPSLLQILKPLGKPRIDRGFLGWREHLIRIDHLVRCRGIDEKGRANGDGT